MENSSKFQLQRTLSIQSCFRELNCIPASGGAEEPDLNNTGITSYPFVQVQPTHCSNGQIPNHTSLQFLPTGTQAHRISFSEGAERTNSARNLALYVPLYLAALKGDWEEAKEFFNLHPQAITARITNGGESVLHIAAGAKRIVFVEELVKMMDPLDLALKNKYENTALCFAVASGITKIVELMVAKNRYLPMIRGINGVTALHIAALLGYRDMVWYISSVTDSQFLTKEDYVGLLIATISSDLYDVALHILEQKPELAIERDPSGETALHVLAQKTPAFSGKSELGISKSFCLIYIVD